MKNPINQAEFEKRNNNEGHLKQVDFVEDHEFITIFIRGKLIYCAQKENSYI